MKNKLWKKVGMVMVSVICLSFVGCGNGSTAKDGNEQTKQAQAEDGEEIHLKLAHIMTADHPNGLGAEEFARLVSEKTNGKVTVDVFPASQLGNEKEIFDAVEIGSVDFAILGYGDPAKKYADVGIFDAPYLANDRDHMIRILNSEVTKELFEEMTNHMDAKALSGFYFGARYLTTNSAEVYGPSDMKGLNIRVPDQQMYIDTMSAMGAKATPMAFSEVFLALQQGVIDGEENPLASIATNKFDQVQKYLIKTEHIIGTQALYGSTQTMDSLPEEYADAVQQAAEETAEFINQKAIEAEDKYLDELQENGMVLIEDVDKEAFKEATEGVYSAFSEEIVTKIREIE